MRPNSKYLLLFISSFITLYLELFIIRWISTEIRIFAYIHNMVLLACFLGFGLGCFFSEKKFNFLLTPGILAFLVIAIESPGISFADEKFSFHLFRSITDCLSVFEDSLIWNNAFQEALLSSVGERWFKALALVGLIAIFVLFALIMALLFPLGQLVGKYFNACENTILAYSVNVLASLLGIWCFTLLSLAYSPPWVWLLIGFALLFLLTSNNKQRLSLSALAAVALFVSVSSLNKIKESSTDIRWSPYQKLQLTKEANDDYIMYVNNTDYMFLSDLSPSRLKSRIGEERYQSSARFNQYDLIFRFHEKPSDVLILGAGGGNNVAGALRNGANSVDAVEIDPGIIELGSKYHPEKPYKNPKVQVINDDARSFFKKSSKSYDLISFGLLDSHTLSSSYNNTRLDHYVYTRESFEEAKNLLKPKGMLALTFVQYRPWIGWRLQSLLKSVFGHKPIALRIPPTVMSYGGNMYLISSDMKSLESQIAKNKDLSDFVNKYRVKESSEVAQTTDDWPYLYLEKPSVPTLHLCILLILAWFVAYLKRFIAKKTTRSINFHFFFLGAAFLLLEFQNISKASLLFGSTWIVNSLMISAILLLILLANLFAAKVKIKSITPYYALLFATVLLLYILPLDTLNSMDYFPRAITAAILLNLPIFFAGIIFVTSFNKAEEKDRALGSNLLGAACGGLLEVVSFVTGIKFLLILVLVLYGASLRWAKEL